MFKQKIILLLSLIILLSLGTAHALAGEEQLSKSEAAAQLNRFIESQLLEEDVHGISVAIVHKQESWLMAGYGFSDVENEKLTSVNSQYRLGAISSIFTAMLILQLEQKGLLTVNDKISKYLPHLKFATRDQKQYDITIKQLLTHHSGLPLSVLKNSWSEAPPDYTQLFSTNGITYLSQAPDTIYTYSNLGYGLLGYLIEHITNTPYEQILQELILDPLGMTHSGVSKPGAVPRMMAVGYKKKRKKELLFPRDLPSLGVYSNVNDLALLIKNLNASLADGSGLLRKEQVKKMMRIQNIHVALDLGKKVGYGWMISGMGIDNAGPAIWRGGASIYHRSRIALLPDKSLGVAVMANDSRAWEVMEKIAEKALEVALEAIYGINQPSKEQQKAKQVEPYGIKDQFADYYNSFLGFIAIEKGSKSVKAELLGWSIIAKPDDKGWYELQYDLFGFIPIDVTWIADVKIKPALIDGKRVLIVLYKGAQHLFASHYQLNKPSQAWQKRVGTFEIANPDSLTESMEIKDGELVIEDNKLFFVYELPFFIGLELKVPLKVLTDEVAIIPGLGTALNETVVVKKQNGKEFLEYSGYLIGSKKRNSFF